MNGLIELLNKSLFHWPGNRHDKWTIGDATEGTQIFGATGSGKSSGSGQKIARAFLKNKFGGLVLCAKPDERQMWEDYARKENRYDDLIIFSPTSVHQFSPLFFEQYRDGKGAGETINITNLIMVLYELGRNFMSGGAGGKEERFWDNALKRAIARMIDLLKLNPSESLTFQNMQNIITSVPTIEDAERYNEWTSVLKNSESTIRDKEVAIDAMDEMNNKSYCMYLIILAETRTDLSSDQKNAFTITKNYFLREYAYLAERTQAIISESFLGLIDPFLQGMLERNFTGVVHPDLEPSECYEEGKIIILDFPIKEHLLGGIFAQGIYKYCWMQEMERRNIKSEINARPCFLWVDESQFFVNPQYDALFQTTARSSLVCTVYLTQNLNNYIFAMGGNNAEARVKSLLGNLNTKIFHANGDYVTNTWASNVIGKSYQTQETLQKKRLIPSEVSLTERLQPQVLPVDFTMLERGGRRENGFKVEGIIFCVGNKWSNKKNYLRMFFDQNE